MKLQLLFTVLLTGSFVYAQVGIHNINPKASLDISATNQANPANTDGLLIPRIDDFPASNPTADQNGMMVYLTTTSGGNAPGFYYWDNGSATWINIYGTDDQKVNQFALSGTTLGISLENDGVVPVTVDLSSLAGDDDWTDVGTDIERQSGNVYIGDTNTTNNDFFISNRIIDWDDTAYYLDPNSSSKVDEIVFDNGSVSDPSIRFSDVDTGFFSPETATTAYSTNGSEVFRITNTGSIGIGTTSPISTYNLTASSISSSAVVYIGSKNFDDPVMNISTSSGGNIEGVVATLTSSSTTSNKKGFYSSLSGVGLNSTMGFFQSSSSSLTGIRNDVVLGSYDFKGVFNSISGSIPSPSNGDSMGMYNYLIASGTGNFMGIHNRFNGTSTGINKGIYNYFTSNSQGTQYGVHTVINSPNANNKYGTYIDIPSTAGGTHYGIYSDVENTTTGYAGYYLGRVSIGTTIANSYILPLNRGTNGQIIQTDGSGNLNWATPIDTDDQTVDLFGLSGTILGLSLENDGASPYTVDLSSLQDGIGTDNQSITSATLTGSTLDIAIENGTGASVDLSPLQDADWYESGDTPPNSINDNIYTQGNVAIGSANASFRLDIADSQATNYVTRINNTSTGINADGLVIRLANSSNPSSNNHYIDFNSGIGTNRGSIRGNGSGGVNYATTSDRRLKTNIVSIENALEIISNIQPRKYQYKANLGTKEYGFIAQELQLVYPQAVSGDPKGNVETDPMMVDYSRLTPILTAGIKELNQKVKILEEKNKEQEQELKKLQELLLQYSDLEARLKLLETKREP